MLGDKVDGRWHNLELAEAVMNEQPNAPQIPDVVLSPVSAPSTQPSNKRPLSWWLKRLLACNPFYLVSAMLLLYGFYQVSIDPRFFNKEVPQLTINYTSLQLYEILLVVTAVFLARRRIFYDSTLLVTLENMLVLVPFILISQAALNEIRIGTVWVLSGAGGLMVVLRFGGLNRFIQTLELSPRLLRIGGLVLTVNMILPVIYRMLHEHKVGTKLAAGAAYQMNEYAWLLMLPMLCALVLFVPGKPPASNPGEERRWLPLGFFFLWLLGTSVHQYCLGYVYDFNLRHELLAPAIWVLLWTSYSQMQLWLPPFPSRWKRALLVLPLGAAFLGTAPQTNRVFLTLIVLNAIMYGRHYLCDRTQRLTLHLFLISLVALAGGFPVHWGQEILPEFSRWKYVGFAVMTYLLAWAKFSRNPKFGVFGGLISVMGVLVLLGDRADSVNWAVQAGLAFLLMHSLRWVDSAHVGASALRMLASGVWAAHALFWMQAGGMAWMSCTVAAVVMSAYLLARWANANWPPIAIPVAGVLVILSGPANFASGKLQEASVGLLAIGASFVLFAFGTALALTKHRWHKGTTPG